MIFVSTLFYSPFNLSRHRDTLACRQGRSVSTGWDRTPDLYFHWWARYISATVLSMNTKVQIWVLLKIKVYSVVRYNVASRSLQSDIGSSAIKLSPISLITDNVPHLCMYRCNKKESSCPPEGRSTRWGGGALGWQGDGGQGEARTHECWQHTFDILSFTPISQRILSY
jgi:hypothetical protein